MRLSNLLRKSLVLIAILIGILCLVSNSEAQVIIQNQNLISPAATCSNGQVIVYNTTTGQWDTCAANAAAGAIDGSIAVTQIAFGSGVDTITGSADFTYISGGLVNLRRDAVGDDSSINAVSVFGGYDVNNSVSVIKDSTLVTTTDIEESLTFGLMVEDTVTLSETNAFSTNVGVYASTVTPTTASRDYGELIGLYARPLHQNAGYVGQMFGAVISPRTAVGAGTVDEIIGIYNNSQVKTSQVLRSFGEYTSPPTLSNSGTVAQYMAYYSGSILEKLPAGNHYHFWAGSATSGGDCNKDAVWRVNYLGIMAYYNPCFAVYTPGATDFERLVYRFGDTGVFGTDNIAYIGMEVGGTGTLRTLAVLGNIVTFETTPGTKAPVTALTFQPTSGYKSVDGTTGATVTTCTGFKNGLCISGT